MLSRSDNSHLHQQTEVNGKPRREAEIKSPVDRLILAGEPKVQRDNNYTQTKQVTQAGNPPLPTGRIQDPGTKNAASDERHTFQLGKQGAPTYPAKGNELAQLQKTHGLSNQQAHQLVKTAMLVKPLPNGLQEGEQRGLATTANVIGISEARRDPYMAFTSAQRVDHSSDGRHTESPVSTFGKRNGRTSEAGTLSASGKGAKRDFAQFADQISNGQIPPEGTSARRIYDNVSRPQATLMKEGISEAAIARQLREGVPEKDIVDGQLARGRSAASREAAQMTGQLPYNLRPLKTPASE